MDETEGLASRPLANHLLGYGFERIGPLGEIELPLSRAIYAFVACHQIKIYPYAGPDSWIQIKESAPRTVEAHEIFYIGRSKDARLRIYSHGRDLKSRTSGSPAKVLLSH